MDSVERVLVKLRTKLSKRSSPIQWGTEKQWRERANTLFYGEVATLLLWWGFYATANASRGSFVFDALFIISGLALSFRISAQFIVTTICKSLQKKRNSGLCSYILLRLSGYVVSHGYLVNLCLWVFVFGPVDVITSFPSGASFFEFPNQELPPSDAGIFLGLCGTGFLGVICELIADSFHLHTVADARKESYISANLFATSYFAIMFLLGHAFAAWFKTKTFGVYTLNAMLLGITPLIFHASIEKMPLITRVVKEGELIDELQLPRIIGNIHFRRICTLIVTFAATLLFLDFNLCFELYDTLLQDTILCASDTNMRTLLFYISILVYICMFGFTMGSATPAQSASFFQALFVAIFLGFWLFCKLSTFGVGATTLPACAWFNPFGDDGGALHLLALPMALILSAWTIRQVCNMRSEKAIEIAFQKNQTDMRVATSSPGSDDSDDDDDGNSFAIATDESI